MLTASTPATLTTLLTALRAETQTVIDLIESTIGSWDGANWTHELTLSEEAHSFPWRDARSYGRVVRETEDSDPTMCSGDEDCCTCLRAAQAAAEADDCAEHAAECLGRGDIQRAVEQLESACSIERAWGDDPTWRPVAKAAQALLAHADDAAGA